MAEKLMPGRDRNADFTTLREQLDYLGVRIPTLYKQYAEVCTPDGVRFSSFNIDPDFNFCIDGLMTIDLTKITTKKRQRYLDPHL